MADQKNRPRAREKNVTGQGKGLYRRGSGLGSQSPSGSGTGRSNSGNMPRRSARRGGGISKFTAIFIFLIIVFIFLKNNSGSSYDDDYGQEESSLVTESSQAPVSSVGTSSQHISTSYYTGGANSYSDWGNVSGNYASADTTVASGAREKRTKIRGDGKDVVTIMVYMCGTDLESGSGMGTSDLLEMTKAEIGENVNLIVFTGGCKRWNNSIVSSEYNQIYQIQTGGLKRLVDNAGTAAMTDPSTLTSFIEYCVQNFRADRYELILWDHGSGSVAGYGYDEKNTRAGSMSLAGINTALKDAGVAFDFIGFDACLMATAENALMLGNYADYLVASEETEPGVGWYYTDWLTALSANTSMSTLEMGKNIVDSFISTCAKKCAGQKTTLSVIDLAEFSATVPEKLNAFSKSVSSLISDGNYSLVSDARYKSREFASSSKIDQVDIVDFAIKLGTDEGQDLALAVKSAVKYNRTSSDMTNAYGCAVYFPYRRTEYVDTAVSINNQIGVDSEYSSCIREMAGVVVSGQLAGGGSSSPFGSLIGGSYGSSSSYEYSSSDIVSLLESFLGGDYASMDGYSSSNTGFFSDRMMSVEDTAEYIAENMIDQSELVWERGENGEYILKMSEKNWSLVRDLDINIFYDDGLGYMNLGLDNIFSFDEEGNLIADTERTWLAVNGQIVAYYHTDTVDDGENYKITGTIPAFLNGERVELIAIFDNEHPGGYIAGASKEFADDGGLSLIGRTLVSEEDADISSVEAEIVDLDTGKSETVETDLVTLKDGDIIDFICDYYSYNGGYEDSYLLGDRMIVDGDLVISDVYIPEGDIKITYRLTDIYDREYWTESINK